MAVEIKVPALGESVTEATVAKWLVKAGDAVAVDQPLCELETDKVTVEVNATVAGTMVDLAVEEGATVQVGGVLCHIEAGAAAPRRGCREACRCTGRGCAEARAGACAEPGARCRARRGQRQSSPPRVRPRASWSRRPASRRRRSSRPARTAAPPRPT